MRYFWFALLSLVLLSCEGEKTQETVAPSDTQAVTGPAEIRWDSWGVPHIFAADDEAFFFADGWAQMHAHGNTILELYGRSRGRAAEYWGERHLATDSLVHRLGHPEFSQTIWQMQSPQSHAMFRAFVDGMNAYTRANPDAIDPDKQQVLPIEPRDVNLHLLFVTNLRFLAGSELQQAQLWNQRGSNAIAVGPSRSASGKAMLVQNPHLPWSGEFLWFEKHLLGGDRNIYGTSLVGLPGFNIAFNEQLGWTHTVNTIDVADLYTLELADGGYRLDGKTVPFKETRAVLKVRQASGKIVNRALPLKSSIHGPVIGERDGQALALRISGKAAIDPQLQLWRMANARSFKDFESALKMDQLPFFNVIYADREGNIFYLFNGHVPRRPHGDWAYWQGTVPGDTTANLWFEHHPYEDLPRLLNPVSGWLQNANDPPWTSTYPMQLDADDFPPYMAPRGMGFRPQRAVQMAIEDDSITFEELLAIKHDTRMALADRLLDDLETAVSEHGDDMAREAMQVLEQWDRRADNESRGAVLFLWWALDIIRGGDDVFAEPWDGARPLTTPDGLADPAGQARRLTAVARQLKDKFGRLDIPWGQYNRLQRDGDGLPANGAIGQLGVFRVAAARPSDGEFQQVSGGDSWVAVVEFGEQPRAQVLLSYGNSSAVDSPHNGDQLQLFSAGKLRQAWFTEAQLDGKVVRIERREGDRFISQKD